MQRTAWLPRILIGSVEHQAPITKLYVRSIGFCTNLHVSMRSGYAELVSHFSTIIHNTDGWEYAGVYVDQGFGQT
ncbi:MAG: hypothetical protein II008_11095, partial [Oscillospiraceae bacterium]|nr:hypothetical protein [Oscillospiraceae bacterium]